MSNISMNHAEKSLRDMYNYLMGNVFF